MGFWTRAILSFLCPKLWFLSWIYMILQVGLYPNYFIMRLWEYKLFKLCYTWLFYYSQVMTWYLILWISYFYHELIFQVLSRYVSSFKPSYYKLDYWVVTMSLNVSSKLLMLPWFNELIHFDIEKDWFDLSRVRNPQIDYDLINEETWFDLHDRPLWCLWWIS